MSKKLFDYIDKVKKGDSKTMKMIAEYNPNEPQYDSAIGKFRLGDKTGALSDFIKPGEKLPRVDFKLNDTGKYINHPYKGVIKESELKETPFQDIIPKLKVKGPQKKTPLANNYVVDTNGISKGINTYINLKKEKENPPKEIVKTQPTISRGGLEDVLNSDTFYRRKRGLDF